MSMNRREFFGAAPAALVPAVRVEPPEEAYIVMGREFSYNDEYTYEDGTFLAESRVYYDKAEAEKRAQQLNDAFFVDRDAPGRPEDWEFDFNSVDPDAWPEFDYKNTEQYSWNDLLQRKVFTEPYWVTTLRDARKAPPAPGPEQDDVVYHAKWNGSVNQEILQHVEARQAAQAN